MRQTNLCLLTEVWQVKENKKHQKAIENMMEMNGIQYVSTPRPGARRGGGTAIACREENFHIAKLNINIPKPLEACFAILKPKKPTGKVNKFICGSFYAPPRSRHNNRLAEFLATTINQLRMEHPGSHVILGADINDMKLATLLQLDPSLKQIVRGFTNKNGDKTLDVILTDCHNLLQEPTILPPLQVDNGKMGVDSDHKGVQVLPRTNLASQGAPLREKIEVRPFPESQRASFSIQLQKEDCASFHNDMSSTEMVDNLEKISKDMVDSFFPNKTIYVGPADLPYFTEELRKLK